LQDGSRGGNKGGSSRIAADPAGGAIIADH